MKKPDLDDPEVQEYIEYIMHHTKFSPFGKIDEYFFYNQPDGSKLSSEIIGFFDPDGYYFDSQGFDELGGYYNYYGIYCDPDFGYGTDYGAEEDLAYAELIAEDYNQHTLSFIRSLDDSAELTGVISNLPYTATKEQVEAELKKRNVNFTKVNPEFNKGKLLKAQVVTNTKAAAEALLKLNHTKFLGRNLKVEFSEFELNLDNAEAESLKAERTLAPKAEPHEVKQEAIEPEEKKKDIEETKKVMQNKPRRKRRGKRKWKKKQEEKEEEDSPKEEVVNEDGFIIEHFVSKKGPYKPKPTMKYWRKRK